MPRDSAGGNAVFCRTFTPAISKHLQQGDLVFLDSYALQLVELPQGFFVTRLADPEGLVDVIGWALVGEIRYTIIFSQMFDYRIAQLVTL